MNSGTVGPGLVVADRYRLDYLLGEGGMGVVYAATHLNLGQHVAVKFILGAHAQSPEARRRFDNEAKAAARLSSKHVVQVYDNGELPDGTPYIVMELLKGQPLSKRIHVQGPIPLEECVFIVNGICKAIGKAHAAGIVHRDIKPENIYLHENEDDHSYVVKVLDFGVAKIESAGEQSNTRTGSLLGTPLYMSPEQARGLKTTDYRTDLYSLGLVIYTMATGNLAYSGESFGDLLLQICTQPLPGMNQYFPWIPPAVDAWFQKACAREPDARFQSAQEMADAFAIACGFAPAPRVGSSTAGSHFAQAPIAQPPSTQPQHVVIQPAVDPATGAPMPPPPLPPPPPHPGMAMPGSTLDSGASAFEPQGVPKRGGAWIWVVVVLVLVGGGVLGGVVYFRDDASSAHEEAKSKDKAAASDDDDTKSEKSDKGEKSKKKKKPAEAAAEPSASEQPSEPAPTATATAPTTRPTGPATATATATATAPTTKPTATSTATATTPTTKPTTTATTAPTTKPTGKPTDLGF